MHHATSLLYHVCAVASRNIKFASCGTSGNLTLWTCLVVVVVVVVVVVMVVAAALVVVVVVVVAAAYYTLVTIVVSMNVCIMVNVLRMLPYVSCL
jgi:hypothetical protein